MNADSRLSFGERVKLVLVGAARNPFDARVFHHLSLIAFFAWVGLGADGLSSSCYGPEEAFKALVYTSSDGTVQHFPYLGIFVALASAATVLIISASYSQIIELFPSGGGGYLVASKLLSPWAGMTSGCALLMDYVLTITISIASGADYFFSFLDPRWHPYKMAFAVFILGVMCLMNLRGIKESVVPLVPVFMIFVLTHAVIIISTLATHVTQIPEVAHQTATDMRSASSHAGIWGMLLIMLRAFAMGAGTFTGIEAVSNGVPILREPRVETARKTMRYMAASLAIATFGLMLAYLLHHINPEGQEGQTLNAVLVRTFTHDWPRPLAVSFVFLTLLSSTALLFVAAQAGFLDGPRVLVNMALDHWMPHRFSTLSDRLVTHNGVLMMTGAALGALLLTRGDVRTLVVLYSINVFITFSLSQAGMVRHWWRDLRTATFHPGPDTQLSLFGHIRRGTWALHRRRHIFKGMAINGIGLVVCTFILITVIFLKFNEGGWITLFATGLLILACILIRRHYRNTAQMLTRLNALVKTAEIAAATSASSAVAMPPCNTTAKTAVILVNGFNGTGLHTLLNVPRLFPGMFKNFVFLSVGVVDAGNFKGAQEMAALDDHIRVETGRYVDFAKKQGFYAEACVSAGTDVVEQVAQIAPQILAKFPDAMFFGGQLVFPQETSLTRFLHNYTVFAIQRRFYMDGIPVVLLPIRV